MADDHQDPTPPGTPVPKPDAPDAPEDGSPTSEGPPASAVPKPVHPLRRYSLRGQADRYEALAQATTPLLGDLVMHGQATMIYAAPGTGKTLVTLRLLLDAIEAGRIDPDDAYYVNADDSSQGLSDKLRLLQDVGAHVLTPGGMGFNAGELARLLRQTAEGKAAKHSCIIIDTLKKFTDPMHKSRVSEFTQVCREYVMAGGTILALGHTAKNRNPDGTLRYQGTTDVIDDFDAAYTAEPMVQMGGADHRVVKFKREKGRADGPEVLAFAYATSPGISYQEKLASVRTVDPASLDDYAYEEELISDGFLMETIASLIQSGSQDGQMMLAKRAAKECGVSHRTALSVLSRYTGTIPRTHLWTFDKGPRGVRIYRLIDQTIRD